jgi:hypothetical protein
LFRIISLATTSNRKIIILKLGNTSESCCNEGKRKNNLELSHNEGKRENFLQAVIVKDLTATFGGGG